MSVKQSIVDLAFRALNAFHGSVLRLSSGRIGRSAFGMAVVELRTTGRVSGLARTTILTAPIVEADRIVLVASKGGDHRDPEWFRNILANPDVELTINGQRRKVRARRATLVESDELWPRVIAVYRHYDNYRRRANRDIPLVICEPR
jgi:deazaflavin-dependent oxidoreductase (nitroreductase family)